MRWVTEVQDFYDRRPDKTTLKELLGQLTNWRIAHKYVMELPRTEEGLAKLGDMIFLELHNPKDGGPRWHLLNRLHMSYNKLRGELERAEVLRHAKRA